MKDTASSSKSLMHAGSQCASTVMPEIIDEYQTLHPGNSKTQKATYSVLTDSPRKEGKVLSRHFIYFISCSIALTVVSGISLIYTVLTGYSLIYPSIVMVLFLMGLGWTATAIASAKNNENYS